MWLRRIGRPLTAEWECRIFRHVETLTQLEYFRAAVILSLFFCCLVFGACLVRAGCKPLPGFASATAIFLLPGAQNAVFMTNFANTTAPLWAGVSYLLLPRDKTTARKCVRMAAALVMLMLSFFTYPVLSFFFLIPVVSEVFLAREISWQSLRRPLCHVLFFCSAGLLYFLIVKIKVHAVEGAVPENYRFEFKFSQLGEKVGSFFEQVMPHVLTPGLSSNLLVALLMGFLMAALAWPTEGPSLNSRIKLFMMRMVVVCLGLGLVSGYWFVTPAFFLYRVIWPPTALLVLLSVLGFARLLESLLRESGWAQMGSWFAFLPIIGLGGLAGQLTTLNALDSFLELQQIRVTLGNSDMAKIRRVHIEQVDYQNRSYLGLPTVTDEFQMPSLRIMANQAAMVKLVTLQLGWSQRVVVDGNALISSGVFTLPGNEKGNELYVTMGKLDDPSIDATNTVVVPIQSLLNGAPQVW